MSGAVNVWCGALTLVVLGCNGQTPAAKAAPGGSSDPGHWPTDDQSLCERFVHWRENADLEASETEGPGSVRPNIRRIFKPVGDHDSQRTVLLCREIDTNLDGIKDVVRTFNEKGEPLHEEADTNYDGKIDSWLNFAGGRIAEEDVDTTLSTGRPNVWQFYVDGELSRIRRNTHCASGAPDTWEIYSHARLERIGIDSTCDGHVDRWDRDQELLLAEEAAQEKQATDQEKQALGASGASGDGGAAGSGSPAETTEASDAGAHAAAPRRRLH